MKHIRAIIFDLDGVICFTDHYHYLAWKTVADKLKIEFDERINDRLRGVSRMESLEIILEKYDGVLTLNEKAVLAEEKNEVYRALLSHMNPSDVAEEVKSTLKTLKEAGIKLAIGSSSKNAGFILKQIKLTSMFDVVSDGNNISKSKPDPEVFIKAAESLGMSPGECLVVEDAEAGIEAAKAGGFIAVGIGAAIHGCKLCDYRLQSFKSLIELTGK